MEIRSLQVALGGATVLEVDRLQVAPGARLAVLGPNGCGKSTLLRAMAGLIPLAAGSLSGLPPPGRTVLVHQEPYFYRGSLRVNLIYALRLAGRPGSEVEEWLRRAGVEHLAPREARSLSVGERRRAAIARALAVRPDLLLLDEPMAGLDEESRGIIRDELAAFPGTLVVAAPEEDGLGYTSRLRLESSPRLRP